MAMIERLTWEEAKEKTKRALELNSKFPSGVHGWRAERELLQIINAVIEKIDEKNGCACKQQVDRNQKA